MLRDFEIRTIAAIQPIRQFFLAQVLEYSMTSGLMDALTGERKLDDLAAGLSLDSERVAGLLRYLAAEGIVIDPERQPELTAKGREFLAFRPWYELLIGGYGGTLLELPEVMADRNVYASRNGTMVGRGSCGISRHDAIPLVHDLLATLPAPPDAVIDLGCGDGTFLLDLCAGGVRGIGADPDEGNIANARAAAAERGMDGHVEFVVDTAEGYIAHAATAAASPCFVTAFSLQEVLEQQGRPAVVEVVRTAIGATAGAHLAIVEVDHRPLDPGVTRHGLGLAYYNPYYLIHQITRQRLERREFWEELIEEAGGELVARATTDPGVDSTGLELGFLVRQK
ncbi:2-ketoarginine methyltransferase [Streptosporangium sp. NPDC023615]|uniref:2-ketoarginine methyltransferase n=1 Tax=Streptosporangium sp. NPDC023615 TaxID=3154794 RepID=UPI003441A1C4